MAIILSLKVKSALREPLGIPRGTEVTSTVQTILTGLGLTEVIVNVMPRVLVLTSGHEVIGAW